MSYDLETIKGRRDGPVLFAEIKAPPMNLLGPELVRDLVVLIQRAEADEALQVAVFRSADPDYFIAHVDVTRIAQYREAATALAGEPSLALLFRRLSSSRLVTIAEVTGRARGAGSEFILACDMCFATQGAALFSQPEAGFGLIPGAGGIQHLSRRVGRGRALEIILSGDDYTAELAERYGWINRALPATDLADFVAALAHRVARFPALGRALAKERVNAATLADADDYRRDSNLFAEAASDPAAQARMKNAMKRGFQTREAEMNLARMLES